MTTVAPIRVRAAAAVGSHGGRPVALGRLEDGAQHVWGTYERIHDLRPLLQRG